MSEFQIFQDTSGEYRWRLRAGNNEIIATSGEGNKAKADCEHGIHLVKNERPTADVDDQTQFGPLHRAPRCPCKAVHCLFRL